MVNLKAFMDQLAELTTMVRARTLINLRMLSTWKTRKAGTIRATTSEPVGLQESPFSGARKNLRRKSVMKMIHMVPRRVSKVGLRPHTRSTTRRPSHTTPRMAMGRLRVSSS